MLLRIAVILGLYRAQFRSSGGTILGPNRDHIRAYIVATNYPNFGGVSIGDQL